jgi:hypothetical protein
LLRQRRDEIDNYAPRLETREMSIKGLAISGDSATHARRGSGGGNEAARLAPRQPKPPVYFILHVPKTAGTTIVEHLADHCARGVLWRPQPARFYGSLGELPDFDRVRAVHLGHFRGRSLEAYFAGREVRRAVLLRDPVSLQVSLYNFMMMSFLRWGQGTYSFELHLKTYSRNFVLHFLLHRWLEIPWPILLAMPDATKLELLQRHLSRFWFVGAHTDCERLSGALAPDLGVPPVPLPRNTQDEWHRFIDWRPLEAGKLPTATREAILARHPLDQALWETWRGAGFNARDVRQCTVRAIRNSGFVRHEVLRPAYKLARFYHRDLWPVMLRMTAPLRQRVPIRIALASGSVMTADDLLEALRQAPENPDLWRAVLTRCRQSAPIPHLPATLFGSLDDTPDAALCMVKAEILVCCGRGEFAKPFLRFAPALAHTRRQAREITLRVAGEDAEFRDLVRRADCARDRRDWHEGARLYRDALDLYPGHFGYMVQYAHCLKELHEYAAAEIYYRSARALGAPLQDMQDELSFVAARQGHDEPFTGAAAWRPSVSGANLLDDPPTRADIDVAWYVIVGTICDNPDRILQTLRSARTIRGVVEGMVTDRNPLAAADQLAVLAAAASARFIDARRALAARAARAPRREHDAIGRSGGSGERYGATALARV